MFDIITPSKSKISRLHSPKIFGVRRSQTRNVHHFIATIDSHDYILNESTLEPEKNLLTLVRAWEELNLRHKRNLKLVIVTNNKKLPHELVVCMAKHIEQGDLIYIPKISDAEKSFLYSNARLFVSPAYVDSTSTPLFSAMHYACPVVVSDIALHRWVMADAAWYCDPHSENSFTESLENLLYNENADALRESLVTKGLNRVKMFSNDNLAQQWVDLFSSIKTKQLA